MHPNITEAARDDNPRALLVALRDHIAQRLDEGVSGRDLVSLSGRLLQVVGELRQFDIADRRVATSFPPSDEPFNATDL